jgi:hypothetical protein
MLRRPAHRPMARSDDTPPHHHPRGWRPGRGRLDRAARRTRDRRAHRHLRPSRGGEPILQRSWCGRDGADHPRWTPHDRAQRQTQCAVLRLLGCADCAASVGPTDVTGFLPSVGATGPPVTIDAHEQLASTYQIAALSTVIVVNAAGKITWRPPTLHRPPSCPACPRPPRRERSADRLLHRRSAGPGQAVRLRPTARLPHPPIARVAIRVATRRVSPLVVRP